MATSRGRQKTVTGRGREIRRRGEALGTGAVGNTAAHAYRQHTQTDSHQRDWDRRQAETAAQAYREAKTRERIVTGKGKEIKKRGKGLGTGPVGRGGGRPTR